jgi:lysozyme
MAILKLGSKGDAVLKLQTNLKKLGFNIQPDGDFGMLTRNAVIEFQRSQCLAPDGIVGSITQTVIAEMLDLKPIYGIDVSVYQGVINWAAVDANAAKFVFCKVSQGKNYRDPVFAANFSELERLKIMRGTYHFFSFMDISAADQVANFLIDPTMYKKPGVLPPVVDVEWQGGNGALDNYIRNNKTACQKKLMDWLVAVEKATGRKPIIYTAKGFWDDIFGNPAGFENYPLWVAAYASQPLMPGKWKKHTFWQFTGAGHVSGITGQVDRNLFNGSMGELKKLAKL